MFFLVHLIKPNNTNLSLYIGHGNFQGADQSAYCDNEDQGLMMHREHADIKYLDFEDKGGPRGSLVSCASWELTKELLVSVLKARSWCECTCKKSNT